MGPIAGDLVFNALRDKPHIVMACNTRIPKGIARGIFKAAKKLDAAIIFELATTECNHHIGYTGLTPKTFSEKINEAAEEVGHDIWVLHADHISVKQGTESEISDIKELINAQIAAGYTSFAIDASHLFDFSASNPLDEVMPNLNATEKLVKHILKHKHGNFGLEVEVGEIGRKNESGMVLTKPEEAVAYIEDLKRRDIHPQLLAIANGSVHGNVFDADGRPVLQTNIDVELTKDVAKALRDKGFSTRIAQHGTTGTPMEFISGKFPHGDILKANVGTVWQNVFYDVIKACKPNLYKEIYSWVIQNYKKYGLTEEQAFGKYAKFATKEFFDKIYSLDEGTEYALESAAYAQAILFMKAFRSEGTASIVRKTI